MAIIKCDDDQPPVPVPTDDFEDALHLTIDDKISKLSKTLFAVEYDNYSSASSSIPVYPDPFNAVNADIADKFRAALGRYWYLSDDDKPDFTDIMDTWFKIELESDSSADTSQVKVTTKLLGGDTSGEPENWFLEVFGEVEEQTFTDHAFTMDAPFSKKDLEMFTNISDSVKFDLADVESDYDFFAKAYEEGIAPTTVPENALPHLYTEVQKGESDTANIDTVKEGYFREWMNKVLYDSNTDVNEMASRYENVAILDSVIDATNFIDSETQTISAFDILMAYANRENLFPMNVNIEVNTNPASSVMKSAESVGMVDGIVKLIMGNGTLTEPEPVEWQPQFELTRTVKLPEPTTFSWKRASNKLSYDFGWWFGEGSVNSDIDKLELAIQDYAGDEWSTKWNGIWETGTDAKNMYDSIVKYIVDRDEKNENSTISAMSGVNNWDMLYWGDANKDSTKDGDIRVRIYVDERGPKGKGKDGTVYIYEEVLKEDA